MASCTEVSGISLAYDVAGGGDPPIVFVHGWGCDRSYFAPQIEFFAPDHTVLALDLRGHGESGRLTRRLAATTSMCWPVTCSPSRTRPGCAARCWPGTAWAR